MRTLIAGERLDIADPTMTIAVTGAQIGGAGDPLGLALVALDGGRRRVEAFAPINAVTRELRPGARFDTGTTLSISLTALPDDVDRLMLVLYVVGGIASARTLRDFPDMAVRVGDCHFPIDPVVGQDRAVILVELYRRGAGWRLSANGQGFGGGLAAVASVLGFAIEVPMAPARAQPAGRPGTSVPGAGAAWGSGFAIDRVHILTNAHVVEDAAGVSLTGDPGTFDAEIVFADPRNDLALLRVDRPLETFARFRAAPLDLGEDVVVLGFPLQGLLGSGLQASAGNVSSLCGIGNDSSVLQLTAPIASGNSGGPILDGGGAVVGLVHASLDLDRVREGGNNAENVNFGVKAPIVQSFLATAGLAATLAEPSEARTRAAIIREARGYLFRVHCHARGR